MVMKHEQLIGPYGEKVYHEDTTDSEDKEWDFERKMREFKARSENLDWIDKEAASELYHESHYNG